MKVLGTAIVDLDLLARLASCVMPQHRLDSGMQFPLIEAKLEVVTIALRADELLCEAAAATGDWIFHDLIDFRCSAMLGRQVEERKWYLKLFRPSFALGTLSARPGHPWRALSRNASGT